VTIAKRPSSIEAGWRRESSISEKKKENYFRAAILNALTWLDSAWQISVRARAISGRSKGPAAEAKQQDRQILPDGRIDHAARTLARKRPAIWTRALCGCYAIASRWPATM
jgi:hypothetical protein